MTTPPLLRPFEKLSWNAFPLLMQARFRLIQTNLKHHLAKIASCPIWKGGKFSQSPSCHFCSRCAGKLISAGRDLWKHWSANNFLIFRSIRGTCFHQLLMTFWNLSETLSTHIQMIMSWGYYSQEFVWSVHSTRTWRGGSFYLHNLCCHTSGFVTSRVANLK